jgi:hypothetical protein
MSQSDIKRPSWVRHDEPTWLWEVRLDGDQQPVARGQVDDTGLNVLDKVVAQVPALIYQADEEPHTLTIELTTVPF